MLPQPVPAAATPDTAAGWLARLLQLSGTAAVASPAAAEPLQWAVAGCRGPAAAYLSASFALSAADHDLPVAACCFVGLSLAVAFSCLPADQGPDRHCLAVDADEV